MMAHSEQGHKRMENSLDFSVIGAHPGGRNLRQQCNDRPADAGRADREAGPNSTIRSLARRPTQANLGSATQLMKGWKGGRMEVFRIGSISLDGDPYGAVREKY